MRFQVSVALALSAITVATAIPTAADNGGNCNVGAVQCCNSVQSADSAEVANLLTTLGLDFGPITGQVGMNCNPVAIGGSASNSCNAQPVCCEGNQFNGLINIGCSPINVNA